MLAATAIDGWLAPAGEVLLVRPGTAATQSASLAVAALLCRVPRRWAQCLVVFGSGTVIVLAVVVGVSGLFVATGVGIVALLPTSGRFFGGRPGQDC